jgi:hypothetical protein
VHRRTHPFLPALVAALTSLSAASAQDAAQAGARHSGPAPDPAAWPEPTHYISPDGSDGNPGKSAETPWKTFAHAIPQLRPDDVLGVMDGAYELTGTGLINVDCAGGAHAGEPEAPITVRAVHERQAFLKSDGIIPALRVNGCRYWSFLGLVARGADKKAERGNYPVISIDNSHFVALERCLASHANRSGWNANNQIVSVRYSSDILVEECELYYHHRHALSFWKCTNITTRRNYINPRFHRGPDSRGDEAIVFYQSSWSIAENNISEGFNLGFQAHGGVTYDGRPGGSYNRFLGNISIDGYNATRIDARKDPHPAIKPAVANEFQDFLIVRPKRIGLWLSSTTDTLVENATIYGGESAGFVADQRNDAPCPGVPGGCGFTMRNSLIWGNAEYGVRTSYPEWLVEDSNCWENQAGNFQVAEAIDDDDGHVRRSLSVAPTGVGLAEGECVVYVPEGSNMKAAGKDGADIGANVIYRYVDGQLTDEPLWDPATGEFPHGALVSGINDVPGDSLFDVHRRLNVNCNGCRLPYGK